MNLKALTTSISIRVYQNITIFMIVFIKKTNMKSNLLCNFFIKQFMKSILLYNFYKKNVDKLDFLYNFFNKQFMKSKQ